MDVVGYPLAREGVYAPGRPAFLVHTKQEVSNIVGGPPTFVSWVLKTESKKSNFGTRPSSDYEIISHMCMHTTSKVLYKSYIDICMSQNYNSRVREQFAFWHFHFNRSN